MALLCPPGTVGTAVNLAVCAACPTGKYCPDLGMTVASDCPANLACSAPGTYAPEVCPPGQYASAEGETAGTCLACPAGKFCWPEPGSDGRSTESCDARYVC